MVAILLLAAILLVGAKTAVAAGSCELQVTFCRSDTASDYNLVVRSYNGKDIVRMVAYDDTVLKVEETASVYCDDDANCGIATELLWWINESSPVKQYSCGAAVYINVEITAREGAVYPDPVRPPEEQADYTFLTSGCP